MQKIIIVFFFNLLLILTSTAIANPIVIPDAKLRSLNSHKQTNYPAATELTKTEIAKSPVFNLSQFLKQSQSVVRLTHNSSDSNQVAMSLRGFGDNAAANSLILVDGFPLTNPSLIAPNFNSIPLADIERIEILPGSAGSLWGDQAVGGVINIITKHPKKFALNSLLSIGSYQQANTNILVSDINANAIFYKLFASIGSTDNYRQHNQQNGNNFLLQIGKEYSRGLLFLNAQYYSNRIDMPSGLSEEEFLQNPRQSILANSHNRYQTHLLQLLNKQQLNDDWLLETRINYHQTDGDGYVSSKFNYQDSLVSFNPRVVGKISNNQLIFGYFGQYSHYQLTNPRNFSKASALQNDLYAQMIIPINQQIDFTLGAREAKQNGRIQPNPNDVIHPANSVFVTEQGIRFYPFEKLVLFLRRDGNFSFPKANEQTWIPNDVKYLKVQKGTSYETGVKWQDEKFQSQLSFYQLELNNEIAFNPMETEDQPFGSFNNLDRTLRRGVSLSQQYAFTPKILVNGQVNYVNAKFLSGPYSGNKIPAVPSVNGNIGLDYAWTDHWALQYHLLYTGSQYASDDVENTQKKIAGYFLNDVALQYFINSYQFSFEIQNLFNVNYVNYAYYDNFDKRIVYYPAAGRNYLLTFKINL